MTPDLVADIGNSRIKWGRYLPGSTPTWQMAALPADDPAAWHAQRHLWFPRPSAPLRCALAGVQPAHRDFLAAWLKEQGDTVLLLQHWLDLPIRVEVDHPERVGIDRLLNAVAVNARRPASVPAVLVDAGSAVTVDWLDPAGTFRGGAIFPGLRLMAQALHEYTALLPLVDQWLANPPVPGRSTLPAIQAGVYWAVAGGIRTLLDLLARRHRMPPWIYLTGGDAELLAPALPAHTIVWPEMTLEGLRHSAEARP